MLFTLHHAPKCCRSSEISRIAGFFCSLALAALALAFFRWDQYLPQVLLFRRLASLQRWGAVALLGIGRETSFWAMFPQLLALGGGLGLLVPPLTSILLGSVDKPHSGIASGLLNSARQTGSVNTWNQLTKCRPI